MKKIIITLIIIVASSIKLSAQETNIKQDTIATFKVEDNDDVILSSKEDGLSINIAGYEIALGSKEMCEEESEKRVRTITLTQSGIRFNEEEVEEDGFTVKKSRPQKMGKLSIASDPKLGFISLTSPSYSAYDSSNSGFLDLKGGKSIYFGLHLLELKQYLNSKRSIALKTGFDIMCYNFTFADDITLEYQNNIITPIALDGNYKKSKLSTTYIAIPLTLSFNIADKFSLQPSLYAGVLVNSHTKYKRPKVKSDYLRGVNQAIAGTSLSVNLKWISVYCDYNFTELFSEGRGPATQAFSIGIQL
ncbi:MAG: hypothetical protein SNH73_02500 [Rikenellaceae bacterium]